MSSYKSVLTVLVFGLIDSVDASAAEVVSGTFVQATNGFLREPVVGPSRLTILGSRCVITYHEREASGNVRGSQDILVLDLDDPEQFERQGHTVATRFCVTRYRDSIMLVDLESIVPFCNALNSSNRLGPAGTGAVVLSRSASEKERSSMDELANPLVKPLLIDKALAGRMTRIEPDLVEATIQGTRFGKLQGYRGTCSAGLLAGVYPGLALHYESVSGGINGIAWITAVAEKDSTILIERIEKGMKTPREGTVLTIKIP